MKKLSLALVVLSLLAVMVGTVAARTPEEQAEFDRQHYVSDRIHEILDAGQRCSDEIYSVTVDLSQIANKTVTASVYESVYAPPVVTTYTDILAQPISGVNGAEDKVSRFWFYIRNNNRDHVMATWGGAPENTVMGFVYGPRKSDMLNTFVAGIPEALANDRLYDYGRSSGSSSKTDIKEAAKNYKDPEWAAKYVASVFTIGNTTLTNPIAATSVTMDVAPYVKDGQTYVPVRYLAYALGVTEDAITWSQAAQTVTITLGDTTLQLAIGSTEMLVNGEPVEMDVAPEIVSDRTFLPARWVAEALGATVEWDETLNQAVIIMPEV